MIFLFFEFCSSRSWIKGEIGLVPCSRSSSPTKLPYIFEPLCSNLPEPRPDLFPNVRQHPCRIQTPLCLPHLNHCIILSSSIAENFQLSPNETSISPQPCGSHRPLHIPMPITHPPLYRVHHLHLLYTAIIIALYRLPNQQGVTAPTTGKPLCSNNHQHLLLGRIQHHHQISSMVYTFHWQDLQPTIPVPFFQPTSTPSGRLPSHGILHHFQKDTNFKNNT